MWGKRYFVLNDMIYRLIFQMALFGTCDAWRTKLWGGQGIKHCSSSTFVHDTDDGKEEEKEVGEEEEKEKEKGKKKEKKKEGEEDGEGEGGEDYRRRCKIIIWRRRLWRGEKKKNKKEIWEKRRQRRRREWWRKWRKIKGRRRGLTKEVNRQKVIEKKVQITNHEMKLVPIS